jgi:hypothetical protein
MAERDEVIKEMQEDISKILQIVKNFEIAFIGRPDLGIEGIVPQAKRHNEILLKICEKDIIKKVDDHQKYIDADKKRNWMFGGSVATISGIMSALTMWLSIRSKI